MLPLVEGRKARRLARLKLPVVATFTVWLIFTAVESNAAEVTYPAQGGKWSRLDEKVRSPYTVTTPRAGSGTASADEPMRAGIRAYQSLLNQSLRNGAGAKLSVDGVFGPATSTAVAAYQRQAGLAASGTLGYQTAKALLGPLVDAHAKAVGMPPQTLMCHLAGESNLDAGAIGPNGSDLGVAQISLDANPGTTPAQALDVAFSIQYMAKRDAAAFKKYKDWKLAIVSYNSPVAARQWAKTGQPSPRAAKYATRVLAPCA